MPRSKFKDGKQSIDCKSTDNPLKIVMLEATKKNDNCKRNEKEIFPHRANGKGYATAN